MSSKLLCFMLFRFWLQALIPVTVVMFDVRVCPWARLAYIVGSLMLQGFWVYCFFHTYSYWRQSSPFRPRLQTNPAYLIDFGAEKHGLEGRWDHFQVKDPRLPEHEEGLPLLPQLRESEYGSAEKAKLRYGPDGQEMGDVDI
ncbi:hypothetical protein AK812_SmicGene40557 [Symbiodinium microadriaticum]|uniref:Uncharacterized protein n=1 Tax=Symbiodinium microadriaticum TaxID=2951 RepID=A0A1Q9C8D5_SYMMI|nr:hypothetical protein AK812_SmicGene40557 [Symbiodinium microadriaticum]